MPTNALFQAYQQGVQAAVTLPLQDPIPERANRIRFGRERAHRLELANSLYCPAGRWPSRGYVLVLRSDLNNVQNKYATNFQLNFTDVKTGTSLTFQNLSIIHAWCVSRGNTADPDAVYLVELTDNRGILWSPWFQFPTTSQYNIVAPAYPGQYYSGSMNAGVPWDWNGMVGDLWGQMGTFLGTFPGLPSFPTATPEGFSFPGVGAWDALNRILELTGMQVSADHTNSPQYGIVVVGATDAAFAGLQAKYEGDAIEDDYEYIDLGAGRVPGNIIVLFHRRNEYYGTEETVRRDSLQWWTTPFHQETITATQAGFSQFASAPGTEYIWDDFTVRFDIDGNALAADVAQANAIAIQRAGQYYQRVYRGTFGYLRQVYTGVLPFITGSMVDGIRWAQARTGQGFTTTITRGPQPPFGELWDGS